MPINQEKKPINPEEYYSLNEVFANGWVPFVRSYYLLRQLANRKAFKNIAYGTKVGRRILVKGENLIQFIVNIEEKGGEIK